MNVTEPIIQAALLGTAHGKFSSDGMPEALQAQMERLQANSEDPEDFLLKASALAFAYHYAGWEPSPTHEAKTFDSAPPEERPYLCAEINRLLAQLVTIGKGHLLNYAYHLAYPSGKIISPDVLPALIRHAHNNRIPSLKREREILRPLAGKRGEWLKGRIGISDEEEEWDTAPHSVRREMLSQLRDTAPEQALELLQKDWQQLPADQRNELLMCLRNNLSKADEPFLQEVMEGDRSLIVRTTAQEILLCLPDSIIVMRCRELLKGRIEHRLLRGWRYDTIGYTPEMKQLGILEISSIKGESDSEFILRQLAERVPLEFWCECFNCDRKQAAGKLVRHPPFRKNFTLEKPILNFSDREWAFWTLQENPVLFVNNQDLVGLLSPSQREEIEWPTGEKSEQGIPDQWFSADYTPWGPNFSQYVLTSLLNSYQILNGEELAEKLAIQLSPKLREYVANCVISNTVVTPSIENFRSKLHEYMEYRFQIETFINQ